MQACGTAVVGGVHPTKAGSVHLGVPVFASAREAAEAAPFDVTVMFIPPLAAKAAAIDACEAGAGLVVCLTEHIQAHHEMVMLAAARAKGPHHVGSNTAEQVHNGGRDVGK